MNLNQIGELGAIALFQQLLASSASEAAPRPEVGIGDDAAVWQPTEGRAAIETTDLLIEEVHFSLAWCTWNEVGWKAMAVNVSDIAAMGGVPRAAFVSAGLSPDMGQEDALELYRGLADCAAEYGVGILGGDTVAAPQAAVVNVAVYGETLDASGAVLRRDGARVGDAIGVSGPLGASAAYLRLQTEELRAAHCRPRARVEVGQRLLRAGVRCAMDISDGLLADLGKLCAASSAGARVFADRVPVAEAVQRLLPNKALELALTGGEDYELLACGPADMLEEQGLIAIGEMVEGSGVQVLDAVGRELTFASAGYDAFARDEDL
ncbi:MAG TPA: thiamine-phosphate kinase [Chloroflexota bacterium]